MGHGQPLKQLFDAYTVENAFTTIAQLTVGVYGGVDAIVSSFMETGEHVRNDGKNVFRDDAWYFLSAMFTLIAVVAAVLGVVATVVMRCRRWIRSKLLFQRQTQTVVPIV